MSDGKENSTIEPIVKVCDCMNGGTCLFDNYTLESNIAVDRFVVRTNETEIFTCNISIIPCYLIFLCAPAYCNNWHRAHIRTCKSDLGDY